MVGSGWGGLDVGVGIRGQGVLRAWRIPDAVGSRGEMVVVVGFVWWRWWWWSGWVGAFSGQWVLGNMVFLTC